MCRVDRSVAFADYSSYKSPYYVSVYIAQNGLGGSIAVGCGEVSGCIVLLLHVYWTEVSLVL